MKKKSLNSAHSFVFCIIVLIVTSCSRGAKLDYIGYTKDGINRVPLNSMYEFAEYENDIKHYMEATYLNGIIDTTRSVSIITGPISYTFYVYSVDSILNIKMPMYVSIDNKCRTEMQLLNDTLQLLYYENIASNHEDNCDLTLTKKVLLYGNKNDSTILYLTRETIDSESNLDNKIKNINTKELYTYPVIKEVKHYTLQYNHKVDIMDFIPRYKRNIIGVIGTWIDSPHDLPSAKMMVNKSWRGSGRIVLKSEQGDIEYEL